MSVFRDDSAKGKVPAPPSGGSNGTYNDHVFATSGNDVNYTYDPTTTATLSSSKSPASRPALPGGISSAQPSSYTPQIIAQEVADSINWYGWLTTNSGASPQDMMDNLISNYKYSE